MNRLPNTDKKGRKWSRDMPLNWENNERKGGIIDWDYPVSL